MSDDSSTQHGSVTVEGDLDLTSGRKTSVFGDGEMVERSPGDANGDESFEHWPSVLDRDDWTDKQQRIIESLSTFPDASDRRIAELAGASNGYVHKMRHKIRCYVVPDAVRFDLLDEPDRDHVTHAEWETYLTRHGGPSDDNDDANSAADADDETADRDDETAADASVSIPTTVQEPTRKSILVCAACEVGFEPNEKWEYCPRCANELFSIDTSSVAGGFGGGADA